MRLSKIFNINNTFFLIISLVKIELRNIQQFQRFRTYNIFFFLVSNYTYNNIRLRVKNKSFILCFLLMYVNQFRIVKVNFNVGRYLIHFVYSFKLLLHFYNLI